MDRVAYKLQGIRMLQNEPHNLTKQQGDEFCLPVGIAGKREVGGI